MDSDLTTERCKRRAPLLNLRNDRGGSSGGSHTESERVDRGGRFGIRWWGRLRILVAVRRRSLRAFGMFVRHLLRTVTPGAYLLMAKSKSAK